MSTRSLSDLQIALHGHMLNQPSAIAQEVVDGGRISVDLRLNIYYNAYRIRLMDNLRDAYEKTCAYIGDETFDVAALAFIEANPPQHRSLRWHGTEFPQFLARQFPQDQDIAELACIDWQLRLAFDGPNATPIALTEIAALTAADWEHVGFQFAPTLFIAPLRYNSVSIWHALDQAQTPPTAQALPQPAWLLIWRKDWQPHFRTIQDVEQTALTQLQAGASFAQVCAALGQEYSDQEAADVAGASLRTWLQDGLIVGLTGVSL